VTRRYLPDTNVLETTFTTAGGAVRLTDALTLPDASLPPLRELARRVEGLAGRVPMRWRVEPRFGYAAWPTRIARRAGVVVATARSDALAVCAWDAGAVECDAGAIGGRFEARAGTRALVAVVAAHGEPLVFPPRAQVEARLDATIAFWKQWVASRDYPDPWRDALVRSALALKLLVYAPSGALAAAATSSLPERIGGERNWDYRYCWIRDSAFTLEALLQIGSREEANSFFWWFMHATQLTRPRLRVLYRLDGGSSLSERELSLAGYRHSRPVRVGNGAATQEQLDIYGDLLDTAWVYTERGGTIDGDTGRALARVADLVCEIWKQPDRGIWEVRMEPVHFTHSKAMCWVALDRARKLAARGCIPDRRRRWDVESAAIEAFIESRCWSERLQSYVRFAGAEELDASLLLMAIMRYRDPRDPRMLATIDAVVEHLGRGPLLFRYTGDDGLASGEGGFLCCSFWLVEALAVAGRHDEASRLMKTLLAFANDVGLYAEEIDPATGEMLGNFPQALVHLALVSAAMALAEEDSP
jgi:GH15 family glucan-1,4-alpha-glucosidase